MFEPELSASPKAVTRIPKVPFLCSPLGVDLGFGKSRNDIRIGSKFRVWGLGYDTMLIFNSNNSRHHVRHHHHRQHNHDGNKMITAVVVVVVAAAAAAVAVVVVAVVVAFFHNSNHTDNSYHKIVICIKY